MDSNELSDRLNDLITKICETISRGSYFIELLNKINLFNGSCSDIDRAVMFLERFMLFTKEERKLFEIEWDLLPLLEFAIPSYTNK